MPAEHCTICAPYSLSMHKLHTPTIRYRWRVTDGCYCAEKHGAYAEQERTAGMINWRGKLVMVDKEIIRTAGNGCMRIQNFRHFFTSSPPSRHRHHIEFPAATPHSGAAGKDGKSDPDVGDTLQPEDVAAGPPCESPLRPDTP